MFSSPKSLGWIFALSAFGFAPLNAASIDKITVFATGHAVMATAPDSVTLTNSGVWVAYTNGADSTGAGTIASSVVQYDFSGNVVNTYSMPGYVDGLKYDAERNLIWALQNQDGNSKVTLIDLTQNAITPNSPLNYLVPNASRGYDDVVFLNGQIFMSFTNPSAASDPVVQLITGTNVLQTMTLPVTSPNAWLAASPVLTMGATGLNIATGAMNQPLPITDPDSLKLTPWGGLMLTGEADGTLNFIDHPGQTNQAVSFLTLIDPNTGMAVTDLDDCVFTTTPAGSFYLADNGNNRILKVDVSGLEVPTLFASVTSLNMLATVDFRTGVVIPFLTSVKAPHGLEFVSRFTSLFGY